VADPQQSITTIRQGDLPSWFGKTLTSWFGHHLACLTMVVALPLVMETAVSMIMATITINRAMEQMVPPPWREPGTRSDC
jgi:hypothetical protein